MRRMNGIACLLVVAASAASAQSSGTAKDEVIAAQKRFYNAYQSCNAKELAEIVVDDMMYLHSTGGLQKNKTELVTSVKPDACGFDILRVDPTSVRIYGDTAIIFGDLKFKPKNGPATVGQKIASQVFVKRNGKWLFASNVSMEPVPLDTSVKLAQGK